VSTSESFLDFAPDDTLAGFRLSRLELYNWGTFHDRVWILPMDGRNTLLTGDIGSGKSTIVDAVTTLLVPANRVSYNKAAGAGFKERDLRSYVLGYYKSERSDGGYSAKPVALRGRNSYSVVLGVFYNRGYDQTLTLAQVFWQKEAQGQPARFYLVSDSDLNIRDHFSGFGSDISSLRRNLRALPNTEPIFDTFPPYGAAFRRRFGLQSEQALELFHQTVSLKSVGNLTLFVREHMLEAFDVVQRINALISHFDDLNRAHEAVLRAKEQIARLGPLVENLDKYGRSAEKREEWRFCRDGLRAHFASLKSEQLEKRIAGIERSAEKQSLKRDGLKSDLSARQADRDDLKRAIAENGGDRLETLRMERSRLESDKSRRMERFGEYESLCNRLELPVAADSNSFLENLESADLLLGDIERQGRELQNRLTENEVEFSGLNRERRDLAGEVESLRGRRSNIDSRQISIRERLCVELSIDADELPFAGELLAVKEEERAWEGAAERLLHNFGLSLLVPDKHYAKVSDWVDRTHLRGRLVYYRVYESGAGPVLMPEESSLLNKLELKPDSPLAGWLEQELHKRFDYTCCDSMELFRRSARALTRSGQIKGSPSRHEKDDRHDLNDRSRYILGWRNEAKIISLEERISGLEKEMAGLAEIRSRITKEQEDGSGKKELLYRLKGFARFEDVDWKPAALQLEEVGREIRSLEATSDILGTLSRELETLEGSIEKLGNDLDAVKDELSKLEERKSEAVRLLAAERETIDASEAPSAELARRIEPLRGEALGEHSLTVENCDRRERELREWIQARIDAEDKRLKALNDQIIKAMQDFRRDYGAETREVDASLEAGDEYRALLDRLSADDLPQFEERFKALLNENTIREIANFQAQLNKEAQEIKERVERINQSMSAIEYNKDRYIVLEALSSNDQEIRSFRQELRGCTEGSFTGSDDDQYTEAKFLQVKSIINRFRGREGTSDIDSRWTSKVTDVRNWFVFAASERWKEDDSEYEHYTDSGGKSGGQKEKLAYTVLAASLAYQFGLEWGETRSRSFRFVVIDEAFGRGSDESARFGLELFRKLNLQLLIITPLQKIHIIEPFVSTVGFVHNGNGKESLLRTLSIAEYKEEMEANKR
jgi:uncharacterized protein YPO0396